MHDGVTHDPAQVSLQRLVERRIAENTRKEHNGIGLSMTLGAWSNISLVRSRSEERHGKDSTRASLEAIQNTNGVRMQAVILAPRLSRESSGVTAIACVHEATPLATIENTVWDALADFMPPGVDASDLFRSCVCFPMDFVEFHKGKMSVRKCVGVRLVLLPALEEEERKAAAEEGKQILAQVLERLRVTGKPFALEALPPSLFQFNRSDGGREGVGLQQDTRANSQVPEPVRPVITSEDATGQDAALTALLSLVQGVSTADGGASAVSRFECVDEDNLLVYPNIVERRLQALAAVTVPDDVLCVGARVALRHGARILVIGSQTGLVAHQLPKEHWHLAITNALHVTCVEGFMWASEVVAALHHPSHRQLAMSYVVGQTCREGLVQLPTLSIPRSTLVGWETHSAADKASNVLAVVVPMCITIGCRKGLYGYELPIIGLPLTAASHCGVDYLHDPLYNGYSGGVLDHIVQHDAYADALSMRLSPSVFREPAQQQSQHTAALIRLAVSKAASIQTTLAAEQQKKQDGTGNTTGIVNDPELVLDHIDQYMCNYHPFTAAVFC